MRNSNRDTSVTISKVVGSTTWGAALLRTFFGASTLYVSNLWLPREQKRLTLSPKDMRTLAKELLYSAEIAEMDKRKRQNDIRKARRLTSPSN